MKPETKRRLAAPVRYPVQNHPNAMVAGAGTVAAALTMKGLGLNDTLDAAEQAAIFGAFSAGLLVIGRDGMAAIRFAVQHGIRGVLAAIWAGTQPKKAPPPTVKKPPARRSTAAPKTGTRRKT